MYVKLRLGAVLLPFAFGLAACSGAHEAVPQVALPAAVPLASSPASSASVIGSKKTAASTSSQALQVAYDSCGYEWNNCNPSDQASLGFNATLSYNGLAVTGPTGSGSLGSYIDTNYAAGVQTVLSLKDVVVSGSLNHPYSTFSSQPGTYGLTKTCVNPSTNAACTSDDDYIKYIASVAKTHTGLWGYYIGDEPNTNNDTCTGDVPALQKMIADIRSQDTTHAILIVLGWWPETSQADANAQVGCWTDSARNLYVGIDYYPFDNSEPENPQYAQWEAAAVKANAGKGVVGGVLFGDALSSPDNAIFPTLAQMESQKSDFNAANIPNGIYGLYSYPDIIAAPGFDPTSVATKRSRTQTVLAMGGSATTAPVTPTPVPPASTPTPTPPKPTPTSTPKATTTPTPKATADPTKAPTASGKPYVSQVSHVTVSHSAGTLAATLPALPESGDLLIAFVNSWKAPSAPKGWTQKDGPGYLSFNVFTGVVGESGLAAAESYTFGTSTEGIAQIVDIRNAGTDVLFASNPTQWLATLTRTLTVPKADGLMLTAEGAWEMANGVSSISETLPSGQSDSIISSTLNQTISTGDSFSGSSYDLVVKQVTSEPYSAKQPFTQSMTPDWNNNTDFNVNDELIWIP
jgi:hypothetical protein